MIKAQFYKVYNDHSIGDLPINDNVLICSAGNESSQVSDVIQDSVALTTRRGNYFIRPLTSDEFIQYGYNTNMSTSVLGYISFAPSEVHDLRYDLVEPFGQPCCRTWEKLSNIMTANPDMDPNTRLIISRGLVGQESGIKFFEYTEMENAIKLEDVIKDPTVVREISKLQIQYAVMTGLIAKLKQGNDQMLSTILQVSINLKKEECGVFLLRMTKEVIGEEKMKKMIKTKFMDEWNQCYTRYKDLLTI
jgi:L-rhamnose mutarotase